MPAEDATEEGPRVTVEGQDAWSCNRPTESPDETIAQGYRLPSVLHEAKDALRFHAELNQPSGAFN
jgi:hypothetical protein